MQKSTSTTASAVKRGEDHPHARYTDREVDMVRGLREAGWSYGEIARKMDMPRPTVAHICQGRRR